MPFTIRSAVFSELVVKKSRFITFIEPVDSSTAAKQRIAEIRAKYPDARHVCFAFYVAGSSGMSDDGEPSGTAGKPMFNVLSHKKLENVLVVVVRYFGGIKLGAGGLSRAYGGAVSQAIEMAKIVPIEKTVYLNLQIPFALESDIRRVCDRFAVTLVNVQYEQKVTATVAVTETTVAEIQQALQAVAPGNPDLVVQRAD